ncbi:ankyrin repeat domain-containing protein [Pandoraea sp. NPDC090278]|uniref:ankyrin repeat domain-containing protein n=1 Tax=Pandoraea sp. NPDC090278 TaxID=3364391 RepID=UPI003839E821
MKIDAEEDDAPSFSGSLPPASIAYQSMEAYLNDNGAQNIDLVVAFQTRVTMREGFLLNPRVVQALGEHDVRIATSSFGEEDFHHESWFLAMNGFLGERRFVENPLPPRPETQEDNSVWSKVLWEVNKPFPDESFRCDSAMLARYEAFVDYMEAIAEEDGRWPEQFFLGESLGVAAHPDGDRDLIGLPIKLLVDIVDGGIFSIDGDGYSPSEVDIDGYTVPKRLLMQYPRSPRFRFERALWSVDVARDIERALVANRVRSDGMDEHTRIGEDELQYVEGFVQASISSKVTVPTPNAEHLFAAIRNGDLSAVRRALSVDPDLILAVNADGEVPSFAAVESSTDIMAELIGRGSDVAYVNADGYQLIHEVAKRGTPEAAALLLAQGADVDATGPLGWTPALLALLNARYAVLEVLVRNGARLDIENAIGVSVAEVYAQTPIPEHLRSMMSQRILPH